jgi:hypothetical protein
MVLNSWGQMRLKVFCLTSRFDERGWRSYLAFIKLLKTGQVMRLMRLNKVTRLLREMD